VGVGAVFLPPEGGKIVFRRPANIAVFPGEKQILPENFAKKVKKNNFFARKRNLSFIRHLRKYRSKREFMSEN